MKSEKGTWRSHVPFSLFGGRGGTGPPQKEKGWVGGDRGGRRVFARRANSDVGGTLPPPQNAHVVWRRRGVIGGYR